MIEKKILTKVNEIVKKELIGEASGHDYWHCARVAKQAEKIGKKLKANTFVLKLAGFLHDITSKKERSNHNLTGAREAKKILVALGVDKKIIKKVKKCILNHRYTGEKKTKLSLEEKIIQDADKLDVLGAVGIARIFAFAGKYNISAHEPGVKPDPKKYFKLGYGTTAINLFAEKIFLLKPLFHTRQAQEIAKKREAYMRGFIKKFYSEWEGKE